uniref:Uncharacterized protein n=1 Tax=Rhodosorus marinus TaxID=101924 RepID=A0A7S0BUY6_9RHOD|mmetsp:Transcript_9945/g.14399  ORF Transcript_9945/g.14399 Transcript_9945/m.14399 type:complete len:107 (+) Transcript_9945:241-561(+)
MPPAPERRVFWNQENFCRNLKDQFNVKMNMCVRNIYDTSTGVTTLKISLTPTRACYNIKRVRVGLLEGGVNYAWQDDESSQLDVEGDNIYSVNYDYSMSPANVELL